MCKSSQSLSTVPASYRGCDSRYKGEMTFWRREDWEKYGAAEEVADIAADIVAAGLAAAAEAVRKAKLKAKLNRRKANGGMGKMARKWAWKRKGGAERARVNGKFV